MKPILKVTLAVLAFGPSLCSWGAITKQEVKVMNSLNKVYLRWTSTAEKDTYTVTRYNGNKEEWSKVLLATALDRNDFLDHGVLPGKYVYVISGNGGTLEETVTLLDYGTTGKNYFFDPVYETTTQELLNYWDDLPQVWDDKAGTPTGDRNELQEEVIGGFLHVGSAMPGFDNWIDENNYNGNREYDYSSITTITGHTDLKGNKLTINRYTGDVCNSSRNKIDAYIFENGNRTKLLSGSNNGQVLDGNRYIWLHDIAQMKNSYYENASENSAEFFPWAGRGHSWRAVDFNDEKYFINGRDGERCWYITMRNPKTGVYGTLCVWDTDLEESKRPYLGTPLYLNNNLAGCKYIGDNVTNTEEQNKKLWPGDLIDNNYSLAVSENGRSYIQRYGDSKYDAKPSSGEQFLISSVAVMGKGHRWMGRLGTYSTNSKSYNVNKFPQLNKTYTNLLSDYMSISTTDVGDFMDYPGSGTWLMSVKGNLAFGSNNKKTANDPDYSTQGYGYQYRIQDYTSSQTTSILIRRSLFENLEYKGFYRMSIKLSAEDAISNAKYNYVIPMMDNQESEDFFVQLNKNFLIYAYGDNLKRHQGVGRETTGDANKISMKYKRFDLGTQYSNLSGGCTFKYKDEMFLVLPSTRTDGHNYGDFTVFLITSRNADMELQPIFEYYSRKSGDYRAEYAPDRTFLQAEVYSSQDKVYICSYVPGQMIAKYELSIPTVPIHTPVVSHSIFYIKPAASYSKKNLVKVNGQAVGISSGVNKDYKVATALNGHFSWNDIIKVNYDAVNENSTTGWSFNGHKLRIDQALQSGNSPESAKCLRDLFRNYATNNLYYLRPISSDNFVLKRNYELSCEIRPVMMRIHNGFIEQSIGKRKNAASIFNYTPNNPEVKVNVFAPTGGQSLYRVDIYFTEAAAATATNGQTVPVDHYNIYIQYDGHGPLERITGFNTIIGDANAYWAGRTNAKSSDDPKKLGAWQNINYIPSQDVIYGDYNFNEWPTILQMATGKANEPGVDRAVLSYFTTERHVTQAKYIVEPVYAAGASEESELTQYGYGEAYPTLGTTGVDNVLCDDNDEGETVYYNLQGLKVDADNLTTGFYIIYRNGKAVKVYIH